MEVQQFCTSLCRRPAGAQTFLFIGCEVLYREVCYLSALSGNRIDHCWLSQGLHDLGSARMSAGIQEAIDAVPVGKYDAILLGFALCNNGVLGLSCSHTPLVIPKAHDCITLFLGSRTRYSEYFNDNPGTYYLTTGWMERDDSTVEGAEGTAVQDQMGLGMSFQEMCEKYGEDNARYLLETMGDLTSHYSRLSYIRQEFESGLGFEAEARKMAEEKGWEYECVEGDLGLLRRLLDGEWGEDFLAVQPGETLGATHDGDILCTCPLRSS